MLRLADTVLPLVGTMLHSVDTTWWGQVWRHRAVHPSTLSISALPPFPLNVLVICLSENPNLLSCRVSHTRDCADSTPRVTARVPWTPVLPMESHRCAASGPGPYATAPACTGPFPTLCSDRCSKLSLYKCWAQPLPCQGMQGPGAQPCTMKEEEEEEVAAEWRKKSSQTQGLFSFKCRVGGVCSVSLIHLTPVFTSHPTTSALVTPAITHSP